MKLKLLAAAGLMACGTGIAQAGDVSIRIGVPPAYVYYDDYRPRTVYRDHHHHHYDRHYYDRHYYQPRVVYHDVHYYHDRGDHRHCRHDYRDDHRGRGHDHDRGRGHGHGHRH